MVLFYGDHCETAEKYLLNVFVVSSWHYILRLVSQPQNFVIPMIISTYYYDFLWRWLWPLKKFLQSFLINLTLFIIFESDPNFKFLLRIISAIFLWEFFCRIYSRFAQVHSMEGNRYWKTAFQLKMAT